MVFELFMGVPGTFRLDGTTEYRQLHGIDYLCPNLPSVLRRDPRDLFVSSGLYFAFVLLSTSKKHLCQNRLQVVSICRNNRLQAASKCRKMKQLQNQPCNGKHFLQLKGNMKMITRLGFERNQSHITLSYTADSIKPAVSCGSAYSPSLRTSNQSRRLHTLVAYSRVEEPTSSGLIFVREDERCVVVNEEVLK